MIIPLSYIHTECKEFIGTFGKPHWLESVREEHINCRNKVCVFDMTSFAKFEVEVSHNDICECSIREYYYHRVMEWWRACKCCVLTM